MLLGKEMLLARNPSLVLEDIFGVEKILLDERGNLRQSAMLENRANLSVQMDVR